MGRRRHGQDIRRAGARWDVTLLVPPRQTLRSLEDRGRLPTDATRSDQAVMS